MSNEILYSYQFEGIFSHKFLLEAGEIFETKLMPLIPYKVYKTFLFCVNEFIQNISYYSLLRALNDEGKEYGIGYLSVQVDKDTIKIKSRNKVSKNQFEKIISKVYQLNNLNQEQLKQLKREKLKTAQEEDSQGGGVGFLEIIRRTATPILVDKVFPEDENLVIEFNLKYNSGDHNGKSSN